MKYGDLKDQLGMSGPRPFLFCRECYSEFSAHAGDYWHMPDDKLIVCGHCGEPMVLAEKKTVIQEVKD